MEPKATQLRWRERGQRSDGVDLHGQRFLCVVVQLAQACGHSSVGADFRPLSSNRGWQAALNLSDRETHAMHNNTMIALRVRAAQA